MRKANPLWLCLLLLLLGPLTAGAQDERLSVGEDIVVQENESYHEVVCIGCSIRILGTVSHEAVAVGGDIEIESSVGHEAVAVAGSIRLGPNASVGQDAVAVFGSIEMLPGSEVGQDAVAVFGRVDRDVSALVGGETISELPLPVGGLAGLILFLFVLSLITHLLLVLITFLVAGRARMDVIAETIRVRAGASLLIGLGIAVAGVILFIMAAWMGPAGPIVAIIVAVAVGVTLIVGYTALCYWVGRLITQRGAPLLAAMLGVLVVTILQFIPFVLPVFHLLALGCAALSGFGQHTHWLQQQFAGQAAAPPPSTAD
jgi:hypothetical protein